MKLIKLNGTYDGENKITFSDSAAINWKEITSEKPPELPKGSKIELSISVEENDFLSGKNRIVWGTFDLRQAEIIKNALLAMNINSELKIIFGQQKTYLLRIFNEADINDAIDFIWRGISGLRLTPDWTYADGKSNKSFEQWLSGH